MAEREVFINVELGLASEEFEKELDSIAKDIKPLKIPVDFNLDGLNDALKSVKSILNDVKSVTNSTRDSISNISNPAQGIENEIKNNFKNTLAAINENIKSSLKSVFDVALSPIKETFKGVFTGIGMSISQSFSQSFSKNIETAFGKSLTDIGASSGVGLSKLISDLFSKQKPQEATPDLYKAIFRETANRSGAQIDEKLIPKLVPDLKEGAAAKYSAQGNSVHLSQSDYKKLQSGKIDLIDVDTLAHEFRHALQLNFGQQGAKLGVNLLRGTKQELQQLQSQIDESTRMGSKGQSQEVAAKIKQLETDAYVFALRTAQDIHNAITGVKTSPKNQNIKNQIQQQQNQLADEVTKSNIQSLEQLTRQQMLQIAKSTGVRGVSQLKVADLRSNLLRNLSPDELSFRIPTFSKPPAEISTLAQSLLSQPVDAVRSSINNFSKQIQSTIKANTKQVDSVPVRQALDDIQKARQTYAAALAQDIDKQTSDILKAAIARLGKQRIALQSRLSIADAQLLNQQNSNSSFLPQGVQLYRASRNQSIPPSPALGETQGRYYIPQQTFANAYQGFENRLYNSPTLRNMSPVEAQSMVSEATGFLFSGATLAAPLQTAIASIAPLALPLTPILATAALAANIVNPIVSSVITALKTIEPIRRRFESTSGGVVGAREEESFARGIVDQYQVALVPALSSYSQLLSATRNTSLEGEPTRELFEGISVAVKALGADSESTRLIFYAFTQMAAKGTISMEELRQQLGEKFPPAIDIFAKAAGVSQAELGKLVASGKLLSSDVLPKVARQLKIDYAGAAASAAGDFISAQVQMENSIFKIQEGLAKVYGPLITGVTNAFNSVLSVINGNFDNILKSFNIFMIGVVAQFGVGLSVILKSSGLVATASNAFSVFFGKAIGLMTPFLVGTFIDLIDDVFGTRMSVMDNMVMGFYNLFASTITLFTATFTKLQEVMNGTTLATAQATGGLIDIGKAFMAIKNAIPSVVVEFVALVLMLNQTYVLAKLLLGPMITGLWTTLTGIGASFIAAAKSGKIFEASLGTLTGGLAKSQLAMMGATAAFLLFFSKAKFTNEVGKQFDDLTKKIVDGSVNIKQALKSNSDSIQDFARKTKQDFESQGFDLTFGLGEQFAGGAFRTDDLLKFSRGDGLYRDALKNGKITQKEFQDYMGAAGQYVTFAEKLHSDNLLKLSDLNDAVSSSIDATGLLSNAYKSLSLGKSIDETKRLDIELKALQQQRVELVSREDVNTNQEIKDQVTVVDGKIKEILKQRSEIIKPFKQVADGLDGYVNLIRSQIKSIDERTDLPESARNELKERLSATLQTIEVAQKRLKKVGVDLTPQLGVDFQKLSQQIQAQDTQIDIFFKGAESKLSKRKADLQEALASGSISQPLFDSDAGFAEQKILEYRVNSLEKYISTRKEQIKQLMLLPQPTQDQQETITKNQKLVLDKENELNQARQQLAQNRQQEVKREREEYFKDFDEVQVILENRQKAGIESEEDLLQKRLIVQQQKGEEQLKDIEQRRKSMLKTDKEGLEALLVEEAQANANIKEAQKTAFDQRLALSQKRADQEIAIAQASKSKGLLTETEFNQQQYDIRVKYLDDQLAVLKVKSQFTAKADIDGQNLIKTEEAKILQQRIEARKAFVDAQLVQLEREQQKATDLVTLATKEREIELQRLVNSRVIRQEDVQSETLKVTRTGIEKELELERNKLQQLESFPKYNDPVEEEGRQAKIRQSRIRTSDLQLQLLQNEKSQQEAVYAAYARAIDRTTQAIANRATAATQSFSKELLANSALEKSLSLQNQLLDAQRNLRSAIGGYVDAEFQILQETAKGEREKKKLAEAAANIKLQSARLQAESDRQSLELQIQQTEQAQRRLEVENAIAQVRNRADVAKARAESAKVSADPNATPEQKEAAQLGVVAAMAEGEGLQQQSEFLVRQRATNAQTNQLRRQTQELQSGANITRAEFEAANAIANRGDRRRALRALQQRASSRIFGTSDRGEASNRLDSFNDANKGRSLTPLEAYRANIVQNRVSPALPQIELPKVMPMLDKTVSSLGTAVDSLVQLVQQKLSTPASVTIATPINNYFPTTPNPKDVAAGNTQATRKELYDLAVLIGRS